MPKTAPTNRLEAASKPWMRAVKDALIGAMDRAVSRVLQNAKLPGTLELRIVLLFIQL